MCPCKQENCWNYYISAMSSAIRPHRGQGSFLFLTSHAQFKQNNAALCGGMTSEWTRVNFAGAVPQERQTVAGTMGG